MFSQYSYPIICTDKFADTVAFYEDHFGYASVHEIEGFVILKREGANDMYLSIIDAQNPEIPAAYRRQVSGMILNFPVDNVDEAFQELYWEGLAAVSDPKDAICGRKHFFVEDPNGILIDVAENIEFDVIANDQQAQSAV